MRGTLYLFRINFLHTRVQSIGKAGDSGRLPRSPARSNLAGLSLAKSPAHHWLGLHAEALAVSFTRLHGDRAGPNFRSAQLASIRASTSAQNLHQALRSGS